MKTRLTVATIRAIEAHHGVSGVSLRGIAKAAGCSHVNVYHYVDGLAGLFWLAYDETLEVFSSECLQAVTNRKRGENFGAALARCMVTFALEHEGLYRLLWSEDLQTEPQNTTLEAIARSKARFTAAVFEALRADGLDAEDYVLADRQNMLFAYLQGEIAILVNGRAGPDKLAAGDLAAERAERLWILLLTP